MSKNSAIIEALTNRFQLSYCCINPEMNSESSRPPTPESYPVAVPPFQVVSETSSSPQYTAFSGSLNLPLHASSSGPAHLQYHRSSHQWSAGLCHCFDDPANCLITLVCPCVTFGQIADIANRVSPTCVSSGAVYALLLGLTCLPCLYSCFYRLKLRIQFDLEEAPCQDCLVHFCCEHCALCQEYTELRNRGFDMGIGWQANMERQIRGITTPPSTVQGMMR